MANAECEHTVGFLALTERSVSDASVGTRHTRQQQRLDKLSQGVKAAGGAVIKQLGNKLMCSFPEPLIAVHTAINLAGVMESYVDDRADIALSVGLHHGPVVEQEGDLFGDTVNIAARVMALANPGQILTTEEVVHVLEEQGGVETRFFDELRVKGSSRLRRIFYVLWAADESTVGFTRISAVRTQPPIGNLILYYGDAQLNCIAGMGEVRLGRDIRCELVIHSDKASRFHAVIETNGGRFLLRDQSTNGTSVCMQGSPLVMLRRETLSLLGEGTISLGAAVSDNSEHLIRFVHG